MTEHNDCTDRFLLTALAALWIGCLLAGCGRRDEHKPASLEDIAANEEVLSFMKAFDGRGVLSDSSQPSSPQKSLAAFRFAGDLELQLILAEPDVTQPVHIHFDHRGRLWVVQYNQYPYPRDLKVTGMDQHIRATYDRVPPPPGQGSSGADKVTFFEDEDGDGVFEKSTDAITGLSIATSVVLGRGHIWVLNPPYLLAYPDSDDDGIPDSDPEIHLRGFGLEDTHAVANSLRWGPDGWLYGAQGSTCSADVSSAVSKNVRFDGQAIWRYHPESRVFEVFAEGGGNTFDVEIDAKGRLYSGDNGTSRGQYYKQGAYYVRNFGKHGALTNPHAFGFLQNMALKGEKIRFTHAFIKYEESHLPGRYHGRMISINPLRSFVQLSRFGENGSTFSVTDEERILETGDHWFRPVDITTGPDGAVFIADWYDSRISHVDPRDTWSKKNGRIYRLGHPLHGRAPGINIKKLPGDQLIDLLAHPDRWYRQQAISAFADRKDKSLVAALISLLSEGSGQLSLEALWALNLSGGFSDDVALMSLRHKDPFVRMWAVRLLGDRREVTPALAGELSALAATETHPEVRSQLAASARRLPGTAAVPIIGNLLKHHDDAADPDLPLQIWWALEAQTYTATDLVLKMFDDRALWMKETVTRTVLSRLMQRYALGADSVGYHACAALIRKAPSVREVRILFDGLQEGLRGRDMVELPSALANAIRPYEKQLAGNTLVLAIRQGDQQAIARALAIITDGSATVSERLTYIRIFGEVSEPRAVSQLLEIIDNNQASPGLKQAALQSLQRYDEARIGQRVAKAYPDKLRSDPGVRLAALSLFATRAAWATELLQAIDRQKLPGEKFIAHTISREDIPVQVVRQLKALGDPEVTATATRLWPDVRFASDAERSARMGRVAGILQAGAGEPGRGKLVFRNTCGPCHRLFDEGGDLGPDLTGYDRKNLDDMLTNIVDPDAYVREGYATYRVAMADGRILTGRLTGKSGTAISLNLLSGEEITVPEGEIAGMRAQPSMMPDNLLEPLSDQQIRDLFAYLTR